MRTTQDSNRLKTTESIKDQNFQEIEQNKPTFHGDEIQRHEARSFSGTCSDGLLSFQSKVSVWSPIPMQDSALAFFMQTYPWQAFVITKWLKDSERLKTSGD